MVFDDVTISLDNPKLLLLLARSGAIVSKINMVPLDNGVYGYELWSSIILGCDGWIYARRANKLQKNIRLEHVAKLNNKFRINLARRLIPVLMHLCYEKDCTLLERFVSAMG